jgi:hypothetical protein
VLAVSLLWYSSKGKISGHLSGGIVSGLLRDRDTLDACLDELAHIQGELERIAEEPGEGVNDNGIEGGRGLASLGNHLLEDRATVIGGRSSRLDVFDRDGVPLPIAPLLDLPDLIGNGKIHLRRGPWRREQRQRSWPPHIHLFRRL